MAVDWIARTAMAAVALLLAGCTQTPRLQGQVGQYVASYRTTPHYRAFAVARGTGYAQSFSAGYIHSAASVQAAIAGALEGCQRNHDASLLAPCRLYELGNISVYGMDDEELALAACVYARNPTATTIEGVTAETCSTARGPAPSGGRSRERYAALGAYRALASTGDQAGGGETLGWSRDAVSVGDAIDAARRDCERRRKPGQAECRLEAIGGIDVAGGTPDTIAQASCLVVLDPDATSLAGPDAARCEKVAALPSPAEGVGAPHVLTAEELRRQVIGKTAASLSGPSVFVHFAADGMLALRTGREPHRDTGSWRIDGDGGLCLRLVMRDAGGERCGSVTRDGDGYRFDDQRYRLIAGDPLAL